MPCEQHWDGFLKAVQCPSPCPSFTKTQQTMRTYWEQSVAPSYLHSTNYLLFSFTWSPSSYWAIASNSRSQCLFYFSNLKMSKEFIFSCPMPTMNFLNSSSERKRSCRLRTIVRLCTSYQQHAHTQVRCPFFSQEHYAPRMCVKGCKGRDGYHLCFIDSAEGEKHPKWAYCNLEESLSTFKALDHKAHF